ncbi:MAG TPA: TolC family protein [Chthonomonadaceae bacterium]|nr:TolC family protein [Chthonomonadaceae bacterium]
MNRFAPRRGRTRTIAGTSLIAFGALPALLLAPAAQAQQQQPPPPQAVPGQTPPISPNVRDTVIPPPVTLPGPPARPPDVASRPLTAEETVRIALHNQPSVIAARAAIAAAQGRTQQARSGLLPQLSIVAGYTNVQTISTEGGSGGGGGTGTGGTGTGNGGNGAGSGSTGTGTGGAGGGTVTTTGGGSSSVTASGTQISANLRQLIFDFNHTRDTVREASLQERAALENLIAVQSDLVFQVKQAFYQYVNNTALVKVNEDNVANRRLQLDLAQARLNSGLGLPSDVVTAQTAFADAATALITARTNQGISRINLALIMGIDPRTPIDAATSAEPPVATNNLQSLVDSALKQRPEVLQANSLISAAKYGVSAARTTNAPVFSGNLGFISRGNNIPPGNDALTIGISLQWSPIDGGLTAGRVKEARANVDIAQANLLTAQLNVTSDVSQAYVNLRAAEQRLVTSDTEVFNALEGVRIAQGRFARGIGQFLDIINAQAALVTAQTNRAEAQFGVDQSRAAMARAIGAPLPR